MSNERKLEDVAMTQELWAEATTEMFREDWAIDDQAEYYGKGFLLAYRANQLSASELKDMTKKANWLEREVIDQSGGNIVSLGDADYIEAISRRVAHHALKYALERYRYAPRFW